MNRRELIKALGLLPAVAMVGPRAIASLPRGTPAPPDLFLPDVPWLRSLSLDLPAPDVFVGMGRAGIRRAVDQNTIVTLVDPDGAEHSYVLPVRPTVGRL